MCAVHDEIGTHKFCKFVIQHRKKQKEGKKEHVDYIYISLSMTCDIYLRCGRSCSIYVKGYAYINHAL